MPHRTTRPARQLRCALVAALAMCASASAGAEDFWCGDKIISNGMSSGAVLAACGRPTEVRTRPAGHHRHFTGEDVYDPAGELWTYNFGSSRLMQRLLFVNGVLTETTTLSFGYDN